MNPEKKIDPSSKKPANETNKSVRLLWAFALILMGLGVVFRVPVVVRKLVSDTGLESGIFFIYFSFYLIAIILIGGGIKKIYNYYVQ